MIARIDAATARTAMAWQDRRNLAAVCVRYLRQARRRRLHLQLLRMARDLDHEGLLADVQTACGPFRR